MTKEDLFEMLTIEDVMKIPVRSAINDLKRADDPEHTDYKIPEGEDAPKAIFWRGTQWAVTDYGIETWRNAPYHYFLAYDDLTENEHIFTHLAEKGWCDPVDMLHAAAIALQRHAKQRPKKLPDK